MFTAGRLSCRVHFVRIDENALRYCVTRLDEPIPAFTREAVDTWAWATDTMSIGLRADPVPSGGPKTAVRVPGLREILSATETYTVQRREGFIGSYTITAPSFTVVGEARFYPLTPLAPPKTAWQTAGDASADIPSEGREQTAGITIGNTDLNNRSGADHNEPAVSDPATPFVSPEGIAHAYPHYDVKKGFFQDPLRPGR